jgi:predicted transcriptional regulator
MSDNSAELLIEHTTKIVCAYASNNQIHRNDLQGLIAETHNSLCALGDTVDPQPEPAVPIKKSVTDHHIICLEDGAKLKMLKRYLRTHYNMSPDEYRARWGLPADYPMVAPEYAQRRSDFAKKIGLGKKS